MKATANLCNYDFSDFNRLNQTSIIEYWIQCGFHLTPQSLFKQFELKQPKY